MFSMYDNNTNGVIAAIFQQTPFAMLNDLQHRQYHSLFDSPSLSVKCLLS